MEGGDLGDLIMCDGVR